MGNPIMISDDEMILTSLWAKRDRLAVQLDAVEGVLHHWHTHIMSKDIEILATLGLMSRDLKAGRPNFDTIERTQLRLMNRIHNIDELMGQDHGLNRSEFDRQVRQVLTEDITIRPIDIFESSLTPDP